jgi:hypothetical protein
MYSEKVTAPIAAARSLSVPPLNKPKIRLNQTGLQFQVTFFPSHESVKWWRG